MQTLPQQTLIFGADEWTSLQVGFPAKMLVKQSKQGEGDNLGLKEKEPDYGGTCAGRLMKSARAGLLQKTLPISQDYVRFGCRCTPQKSQVLPGCLLQQRPITRG